MIFKDKTIRFKFLIFLLFILVLSKGVYAQGGVITGRILDENTKEPLIGATIRVVNISSGKIAGMDGDFKITGLKSGKYSLIASFISYKTQTINDVEVVSGKETPVEILMSDASLMLNSVTVMAVKKMNTDVSMLRDIKSGLSVVSGISAQQISKTQDNDAAEVLTRIPGVTIVDDRFVVVRGLAQRYNNVWLNNATSPSSETDSRAFSFDVLPSSLIENMMIFKTPTAELPADFTGGFVKVLTKNMPTENNFTLQYSIGGNSSSTFNKFYGFEGISTDWLGFGAGSRSMPSDAPANLNKTTTANAVSLTRDLNYRWAIKSSTALPDQKLFLTFNRAFGWGASKVGNITAINYSNGNDVNELINNNFNSYNVAQDKSTPRTEFNDQVYKNTVKLGALFNWSVLKPSGTKYEFRNFFNQRGTSSFTNRVGTDYYSTQDWHFLESLYTSRTTYSSQLSGDYGFKEENKKLDWVLGYAFANYNEPDRRVIGSMLESMENYYRVTDATRFYQQLQDNSFSAGLNFQKNLTKSTRFSSLLKTGLYGEYKMRDFSARRFSYNMLGSGYTRDDKDLTLVFADENIASDKIYLIEKTNKSDSYNSYNTLGAGYVSTVLKWGKKLIANIGLRTEYNRMQLDGYQSDGLKAVHIDNNAFDLFPSLNASYNVNEKNLFRLSYGRSVNRAEFREVVPYVYYNFDLFANISGNQNLKNAYVNNVDVRYEWYPSSAETFTLGAFYKDFSDPIEQTFYEVGSGNLQYTYHNADKATCYGAELDLKKRLDFIGMKDLSFVFNGAVIKSKVQFGAGAVERDRPLQGQSPYLINTGLFYQNDKLGFSATLLYNRIGKRIETVGIPKQNQNEDIPDVYEMPRNLADIILVQKIGKKVEIKGSVKNLLNARVRYQQDLNIVNNGQSYDRVQIVKDYRPGIDFNIGVTAKF